MARERSALARIRVVAEAGEHRRWLRVTARGGDEPRSRRLVLAGGALLALSLSSLGLLTMARATGRPRAGG
jgi:hypothetical protein